MIIGSSDSLISEVIDQLRGHFSMKVMKKLENFIGLYLNVEPGMYNDQSNQVH